MKQVYEIRLDDEIIPSAGIGNLRIGDNIYCLRNLSLFNKNFSYTYNSLDFPVVIYKKSLKILFNPFVGKISGFEVIEGYTGKLWENIGIGSLGKELYALNGKDGFEFCEYEDGGLFFTHKKSSFSIFAIVDPEDDMSDFDVALELPILSIHIFDYQNRQPMKKNDFPEEWTHKYPQEFGLSNFDDYKEIKQKEFEEFNKKPWWRFW